MSQSLMFPERKQCKGCRRTLGNEGAPVLYGEYCSPKCAGIAEPSPSAAHASTPRECRTQRDGEWVFKRRYRCLAEIPERMREDPAVSEYWCAHCGHLHVGRTLVDTTRGQNRGLRSRHDIAEVLRKARGHATHKEIGAVLGVRPIRIKEWEDSSFDKPSVLVLFRLLRLYRIELAAIFG